MKNTADVVIVGAGIIGCATAYYLAKKGSKVIVLDASDSIGSGGSTRNGGGVRQSGRDPRELPLIMYAVKNLWPKLNEELNTDVEYYQEGNLRLGKSEKDLKILEGLTARAVACGLDVKMISGDEARKINPYLSDIVVGASWCETDGHANPLLTTLAYYKEARKLGVEFITNEKVIEIQKVRGKARKVIAENGIYEGDTIIVAAGFESREILASVGLDVPMVPHFLETLVTEAVDPMFYQMLGTAAADFYGHQTTHGSFVFGMNGALGLYTKADNQNGEASSAPKACKEIMNYFPSLADIKIVRSWTGWMDSCVDHVPVISKVDDVEGLIIACGFSGHGFGIAPIVGILLSELARDEELTLSLDAFRYDRF